VALADCFLGASALLRVAGCFFADRASFLERDDGDERVTVRARIN
jgi:hypothetical protein